MTISEMLLERKFDEMLKEMKAIKELLVRVVESYEPDVICDAQTFPITIIPPSLVEEKDDEDTEDKTPPHPSPEGREEDKDNEDNEIKN